MKNILIILLGIFILTSCACDTDFSTCEYQVGDQVRILNKSTHNGATVSEVTCGCDKYYVEYFTTGGFARGRYITEGGLAPANEIDSEQSNDGYLDKIIKGVSAVKQIKEAI